MSKVLACVILACVLLMAGIALRAAAAQDGTAQPGQPTQAKVWIQNRGDMEAVPVRIQGVAAEVPPLRVQVIGPTVTGDGFSGQARGERLLWEYQDVTIPSGQSPAAVLNGAGADGWEVTGAVLPVRGGTLIVMKRPR